VFLIGVGNVPWQMNPAVRKKFTKRIYIPLPDSHRRKTMITSQISKHLHSLEHEDLEVFVAQTEG